MTSLFMRRSWRRKLLTGQFPFQRREIQDFQHVFLQLRFAPIGSSERMKWSREEFHFDVTHRKMLKRYRSENAAIPRNSPKLIRALDPKSNSAMIWPIRRVSIVLMYVSDSASANTWRSFPTESNRCFSHLPPWTVHRRCLDICRRFVCREHSVVSWLDSIWPDILEGSVLEDD